MTFVKHLLKKLGESIQAEGCFEEEVGVVEEAEEARRSRRSEEKQKKLELRKKQKKLELLKKKRPP